MATAEFESYSAALDAYIVSLQNDDIPYSVTIDGDKTFVTSAEDNQTPLFAEFPSSGVFTIPVVALPDGAVDGSGAINLVVGVPAIAGRLVWGCLPANSISRAPAGRWLMAFDDTGMVGTVYKCFVPNDTDFVPYYVAPESTEGLASGNGEYTQDSGEIQLVAQTCPIGSMKIGNKLSLNASMCTLPHTGVVDCSVKINRDIISTVTFSHSTDPVQDVITARLYALERDRIARVDLSAFGSASAYYGGVTVDLDVTKPTTLSLVCTMANTERDYVIIETLEVGQ